MGDSFAHGDGPTLKRILLLQVCLHILVQIECYKLNIPCYSELAPKPSRSFLVTFEIPQHSLSLIKIDQLRVTGESYKPYKGVRSSLEGKIEYRW